MNSAECLLIIRMIKQLHMKLTRMLLIIGMIKQLSHEIEIDQNAYITYENDKVVKADIAESSISNILETLDDIYEDIKV